jgi:hypothetical protein
VPKTLSGRPRAGMAASFVPSPDVGRMLLTHKWLAPRPSADLLFFFLESVARLIALWGASTARRDVNGPDSDRRRKKPPFAALPRSPARRRPLHRLRLRRRGRAILRTALDCPICKGSGIEPDEDEIGEPLWDPTGWEFYCEECNTFREARRADERDARDDRPYHEFVFDTCHPSG